MTRPDRDQLLEHVQADVTTGELETAERLPSPKPRPPPPERTTGYLVATAVPAAATATAYFLFGRDHLSDVAMTYLACIVGVSTRYGFRPSLAAAVLSVALFNYFFIPPYHTFSVHDTRHVTTFLVMLLVAGVISWLTQRVRAQVEVARRGERKTAALYALSQDLFGAQDPDALLRAAGRRIEEIFESEIAAFVPDDAREVTTSYATPGLSGLETEQGVVRWVLAHHREAGVSTPTLAGSRGFYVPLIAPGKDPEVFGVLGIYARDARRFEDPEQQRLAHALAAQIAMALERGRLAEETERARVQIEAEQFRNTLLSSVSHDLRTPLAVMRGAATTLMDDDAALSESVRRDLTQALVEETERLDRLVRNLLDMTRLESGAARVNKEWHSVEEMIGGALNRTESRLTGRRVSTNVPPTLLVSCDSVLIQQVLINLLENAAKYTPPGAPIEVSASSEDGAVTVGVTDRGPGVPTAEHARIFEKFQRGNAERTKGGVGLGLAICRAIVLAHGGRIWVEDREGGGARFRFTLPLQGRPSAEPLPEIHDTAEPARPAE